MHMSSPITVGGTHALPAGQSVGAAQILARQLTGGVGAGSSTQIELAAQGGLHT
jgi:hypothetical protein